MEHLGMNQKELATRLDITQKHLSNIINSNAPITYDTALKLENDLEILKEIPYKKQKQYILMFPMLCY